MRVCDTPKRTHLLSVILLALLQTSEKVRSENEGMSNPEMPISQLTTVSQSAHDSNGSMLTSGVSKFKREIFCIGMTQVLPPAISDSPFPNCKGPGELKMQLAMAN